MKNISKFVNLISVGFMIGAMVWYGSTGQSFVSSKFLFWGMIITGIASAICHGIYLGQSNKIDELKQFSIGLFAGLMIGLILHILIT